jgi:hypothetical protein
MNKDWHIRCKLWLSITATGTAMGMATVAANGFPRVLMVVAVGAEGAD